MFFIFIKGSPDDYVAKSLMAPIPRCKHKLCSDIIVEHDGVVEEIEVFRVTLEMSPGLDPRVHLKILYIELMTSSGAWGTNPFFLLLIMR